MQARKSSLDPDEIARFSRQADKWWDERGPFAPLHKLNPLRIKYIREQIDAHFNRDPLDLHPFKGLEILDIGCGGGLVCEPMARLGAKATGIDGDGTAIETAKSHAKNMNLGVRYKNGTAESLLPDAREQYDVVLALEIVEHVQDKDNFIQTCLDLCKPGGLVIFSTLNRTPKSYALGIVMAEYVFRWVPRGTHNWKKFLKPSELAAPLRQIGAETLNITGIVYNPLIRDFETSKTDLETNYILTAKKQ